jgi:hypothetical protein
MQATCSLNMCSKTYIKTLTNTHTQNYDITSHGLKDHVAVSERRTMKQLKAVPV